MAGLIVDICRFYFTQSISFIKEHACICNYLLRAPNNLQEFSFHPVIFLILATKFYQV